MITAQAVKKLENMIPEGTNGEEHRAAYCVINGVRDGKSANEIAAYYSVNIDLVDKWIDFFDLRKSPTVSTKKRSSKTQKIHGYLSANVGKIVTPKQVADDIGMSLPTFYNFYNANRSYFKKVKRGEFQILNPQEERNK